MCRVAAYLGTPVAIDGLLSAPDNALIRQAYDPGMLSFMNLAGCGFAAWDGTTSRPENPFLYRSTVLPMYDSNLARLAPNLKANCVIAHVRGMDYFSSMPSPNTEVNVHPFHYPGYSITMAHNGDLASFAEMKYGLLPYIKPEIASRIQGTTDSEWIYAVLISQLEHPTAEWSLDEFADSIETTLRILRRVRSERNIRTASGMNLFASNGNMLVATRFNMDFGCSNGDVEQRHRSYQTLWYCYGSGYGLHGDRWGMSESGGTTDSVLIASEPLTRNPTLWIEVPEYTLLMAVQDGDKLHLASRTLDC